MCTAFPDKPLHGRFSSPALNAAFFYKHQKGPVERVKELIQPLMVCLITFCASLWDDYLIPSCLDRRIFH